MGFLGSVNIFHGRVAAGRAHLGPLSVDYPGHTEEAPRSAQGFARPHELELARDEGGGGFWATLRHVNRAGAVVRLELEDEDGEPIHAEATRAEFDSLQATPGQRLYVTPRAVRIFVEGC
jgi:sulfate transport system ATP-binding protein